MNETYDAYGRLLLVWLEIVAFAGLLSLVFPKPTLNNRAPRPRRK